MSPALVRVLVIVGAALAFVALCAGLLHENSAKAKAQADAAHAAEAAAWAASTARAQASQDAKQQENLDEANRFNARRAADSRDVVAATSRVRDHLANGRDIGTRAAAPAGSSASSGMPAAGMVSADVFLRLVDMASDLAATVDCLRGVSELCAADYDALTP